MHLTPCMYILTRMLNGVGISYAMVVEEIMNIKEHRSNSIATTETG